MNKLSVGSLLLLLAAQLASGSLFGPFGPFGPPALPGYGTAAYPGAIFPGRPGLGQLPVYSPLLPPGPFLPANAGTGALAYPPGLGRTLTGVGSVATPLLSPAAGGSLRTVVSGSDVLSRLAVADLPEDLQQRAQELQLASEQGFDACEELLQVPGAYWQYKRCNATQMRNVLTAAKALEQEATARATAAADAAALTEASVPLTV